MKNFIKRQPVLSYYLLVFAISWGGILILIGGPDHIPGTKEQAEKLFVPALLIMFAGPFISGILMNFLIDGKEGLRKLLTRFLRWRTTEGRWYAIAIFTGPILVATVLFGLSLFNHEFLPRNNHSEGQNWFDDIRCCLGGNRWRAIRGNRLDRFCGTPTTKAVQHFIYRTHCWYSLGYMAFYDSILGKQLFGCRGFMDNVCGKFCCFLSVSASGIQGTSGIGL
jgi:hypothetical protein